VAGKKNVRRKNQWDQLLNVVGNDESTAGGRRNLMPFLNHQPSTINTEPILAFYGAIPRK